MLANERPRDPWHFARGSGASPVFSRNTRLDLVPPPPFRKWHPRSQRTTSAPIRVRPRFSHVPPSTLFARKRRRQGTPSQPPTFFADSRSVRVTGVPRSIRLDPRSSCRLRSQSDDAVNAALQRRLVVIRAYDDAQLTHLVVVTARNVRTAVTHDSHGVNAGRRSQWCH